jgi:hypothetical protein
MYKTHKLILFILPVSVVAFSVGAGSPMPSELKSSLKDNAFFIFGSGDIVEGLTSIMINNNDGILEVQTNTMKDTEHNSIPALDTAGQGFFLVYVVFSLLAGAKELLTRIRAWSVNKKL